ncbi:hypothetical protein D9M68_572680 [compost metagenome]
MNDAMFKVCLVMSTSASTSSKRPTLASAVLAWVSARPSAARRRALNFRSGWAQDTSIWPLSLPSSVGSRLCARYGAASESGSASTSVCTSATLSVAVPLNFSVAPATAVLPSNCAGFSMGQVTAVRLIPRSVRSMDAPGLTVSSRQPMRPPSSAILSTCTLSLGFSAGFPPGALAAGAGSGATFSAAPVAGFVAIRLSWPAASRATTSCGLASATSLKWNTDSSGRTSASASLSESKASRSRPRASPSLAPWASTVPVIFRPMVPVCWKSIFRSASRLPACSFTGRPPGM